MNPPTKRSDSLEMGQFGKHGVLPAGMSRICLREREGVKTESVPVDSVNYYRAFAMVRQEIKTMRTKGFGKPEDKQGERVYKYLR